MTKEQIKNIRSKYKKISEQKRLEIIDRIVNKGEQLKAVSEDSGINVSTCKAIIKVYQEEGRVGKKKTRNKVVEVVETYSFFALENSQLTELCPFKIMNSKISVEQKEFIESVIQERCREKVRKMLSDVVETGKSQQH
jgi:transposase-like protein